MIKKVNGEYRKDDVINIEQEVNLFNTSKKET